MGDVNERAGATGYARGFETFKSFSDGDRTAELVYWLAETPRFSAAPLLSINALGTGLVETGGEGLGNNPAAQEDFEFAKTYAAEATAACTAAHVTPPTQSVVVPTGGVSTPPLVNQISGGAGSPQSAPGPQGRSLRCGHGDSDPDGSA